MLLGLLAYTESMELSIVTILSASLVLKTLLLDWPSVPLVSQEPIPIKESFLLPSQAKLAMPSTLGSHPTVLTSRTEASGKVCRSVRKSLVAVSAQIG